MPITGLILEKGYIAVSLNEPDSVFSVAQGSTELIGVISEVYSTCDGFGSFVWILFDPRGSFVLKKNNVSYRIIHESKIISRLSI